MKIWRKDSFVQCWYKLAKHFYKGQLGKRKRNYQLTHLLIHYFSIYVCRIHDMIHMAYS